MAKQSILGGPFKGDDSSGLVSPAYVEIMEEYGIDLDAPLIQRWRELAEKLAEDFHPVFRKPRGRPPHRNYGYYAMLIGSVRWVRERDGYPSDRAALKFLYENHPGLLVGTWKEEKRAVPSFDSLEADLKIARSRVKGEDII
jgi:hypothetical protein